MSDLPKQSLVRILRPPEGIVGCGFVVAPRHILTCAHVLDSPRDARDEVYVDFPFVRSGQRLRAAVFSRKPFGPVESYPPPDGLDVAVLRVAAELPSAIRPVRLVMADELWNRQFCVFGCPAQHDEGVWVNGRLSDAHPGGWLQLDGDPRGSHFIAPGFSGSPVWSETNRGVLGMVVAVDRTTDSPARAAYMIPAAMLLAEIPGLQLGRSFQQPCLIIKPQLSEPQDQLKQNNNLKLIKIAVKDADLGAPEELVIDDVSTDLIEKVSEAELVVADLNAYQSLAPASASLLYYFLALRHAEGNNTVLVASDTRHLPNDLRKSPFTLVNSDIDQFLATFRKLIDDVQGGAARLRDNPIQQYKKQRAREIQMECLEAEIKARTALIDELKKEIQRSQLPAGSPPPALPPQQPSERPALTEPKPTERPRRRIQFTPID